LTSVSNNLNTIIDGFFATKNTSNLTDQVLVVNKVLTIIDTISNVPNISVDSLNSVASVYDKLLQQPYDFYAQHANQTIAPK
jgi:hypothetical protein